jgi:hypothetical protein
MESRKKRLWKQLNEGKSGINFKYFGDSTKWKSVTQRHIIKWGFGHMDISNEEAIRLSMNKIVIKDVITVQWPGKCNMDGEFNFVGRAWVSKNAIIIMSNHSFIVGDLVPDDTYELRNIILRCGLPQIIWEDTYTYVVKYNNKNEWSSTGEYTYNWMDKNIRMLDYN